MKIVIYTFEDPATISMVNRLIREVDIAAVILQHRLGFGDKLRVLRQRWKKYGALRACDEALFWCYYQIFLRGRDAALSRRFVRGDDHDDAIDRGDVPLYRVQSLNSEQGRSLLRTLGPDVVFMESREMIDPETLRLARKGFIGCHPGLLPEYRGAYAPFWAARNLELDKLGFTIYVADEGIDTGGILLRKQVKIDVTQGTFKFHSASIMVESIPSIISTLKRIEAEGMPCPKQPDGQGRLYSLIGLSDYLSAQKRLKGLAAGRSRSGR